MTRPQLAVGPLTVRLPRERWEWVALALGFGLLFASSQSLYFGIVSNSWPEVNAMITYSTAKETRRRSYVDIRYTYAVRGHVYTGDQWRYTCFMNSRSRAGVCQLPSDERGPPPNLWSATLRVLANHPGPGALFQNERPEWIRKLSNGTPL